MRERTYTLKRILDSREFRWTLKQAKDALAGMDYCLIGGLAVAYHANPPVTVDADFLVLGDVKILRPSLDWFHDKGWSVGDLWFPTRLMGYPRRGFKVTLDRRHDVDLLLTGNDLFLDNAVEHAAYASKLGVKVIRPEDLIVMKTLAGRDKDISDSVALQEKLGTRLDRVYIERWLDRLA